MPSLNMSAAHALGADEALRRLKEKFHAVHQAYGAQVSDLRETWEGNVLSFGFKAMGMKVAGTVTVEDGQVRLAADIPLAALMFRGLIEQRIRQELGALLA